MRFLCGVMLAGVLVSMSAGCGQPAAIADSQEARLEQARAVTELEAAAGGYDAMLDKGAALAREGSADALVLELGRELTGDDEAAVEEVMRAALAEVLTREVWQEAMAGVYADLFTAAELADAVEFYGSPTGRKILELGNRLDDAVVTALTAELNDHGAELAATIDAGLAERFPELSTGENDA